MRLNTWRKEHQTWTCMCTLTHPHPQTDKLTPKHAHTVIFQPLTWLITQDLFCYEINSWPSVIIVVIII